MEYILSNFIPKPPLHFQPLIIVQARMGSTRLPGKVMMPLEGLPLIEGLLKRLFFAHVPIVLATSVFPEDNVLVSVADKLGVSAFQGSEDDVLDRFYQVTKSRHVDAIVRITADCPLTDPDMIVRALNCFYASNVDYLSNTIRRTYPKGLDIEIFRTTALAEAAEKAKSPYEREHVTPYILSHPKRFVLANFVGDSDLSSWRLTVDTKDDYELITMVMARLHGQTSYDSLKTILALHPEWQLLNTK
jgi:spore coat polysaccharide biosynthesis protein SpsF